MEKKEKRKKGSGKSPKKFRHVDGASPDEKSRHPEVHFHRFASRVLNFAMRQPLAWTVGAICAVCAATAAGLAEPDPALTAENGTIVLTAVNGIRLEAGQGGIRLATAACSLDACNLDTTVRTCGFPPPFFHSLCFLASHAHAMRCAAKLSQAVSVIEAQGADLASAVDRIEELEEVGGRV
jgi:hypothetical protein